MSDRKYVGFFSENKLSMANNGSIKDYILNKDDINYNVDLVIKYLSQGQKEAVCPKPLYDIFTNELISTSFSIYTDGEFVWKSDLIYYIKKYNLELPQKLVCKINNLK